MATELPATPISIIRRSWLIYLAAVVLFAADRALKALVSYLPVDSSYGWRGWAEFTLFRNEGIAFSLPLADAIFWPLAALALTALALTALALWHNVQRRAGRRLAAALIFLVIMGGIGNLIDRAAYGHVVDYLLFFGRSAVNLADGLIVGGIITLFLTSRRHH